MAGSVKGQNGVRVLGGFVFPNQFEVKKEGPLDARSVVCSITELLLPTTVSGEPKYQYFGMLVTVSGDSDSENDGVYRLLEDYGTATDSTSIDAWE